MAILRTSDGKFYRIPDCELDHYLVPAEEVKEQLAQYSRQLTEEPETGTEVKAHQNSWRNCWRNCYKPPKES